MTADKQHSDPAVLSAGELELIDLAELAFYENLLEIMDGAMRALAHFEEQPDPSVLEAYALVLQELRQYHNSNGQH